MKKSFFKSKKFKYGSVATAITVLTIVLVMVVNIIFSTFAARFMWYSDMTNSDIFTLSDALEDVIGPTLDEVASSGRELKIIFCADPDEIATIVTAIGNHDEGTGVAVNPVAAALILADKSDVRRSRVRNSDTAQFDIHDRVNYSVKKSQLKINEDRTLIKLKLTVDTKYGSVMDYFEIFLGRMIMCRKAADTLGLQFKLIINEQQLI